MYKAKAPFPVRFRPGVRPDYCLYKIWVDDRYLIWKGKSLTQSTVAVSETIQRAFSVPMDPESVFKKLQDYIEAHRSQFIEIEVLHYPESPVDLLKLEYQLLIESQGDDRCLNTAYEPYIPKWIPAQDVTAFNNWKTLKTGY